MENTTEISQSNQSPQLAAGKDAPVEAASQVETPTLLPGVEIGSDPASETKIDPQSAHAVYQPDSARIGEQLEQILTVLQTIPSSFENLQVGFDSKIKYDAVKERVIDNMHRELQTYRDGMHFKIMRPIFFELMQAHDDLTNVINHSQPIDGECETAKRLRKNLVSFQDALESILENHGVSVFNEPGDKFNAQRQRVLRVENTNDPKKDQVICDRVRKGFEYDDKILRHESVTLYKYNPVNNLSHLKENNND